MSNEIANITPQNDEISIENRLEIIDDVIRKKYLARLSEARIAPTPNFPDLESDLIDNVRLFKLTEMVYKKDEPILDKLTTVFNTLATYNATVFVLIDSDGKNTALYLGVRNNDPDDEPAKRSTVTLGDTLKHTLVGHFPGMRIESVDRKGIKALSDHVGELGNVASVSVVGNSKTEKADEAGHFVQGIEKLMLAMSERPFTGLIIASKQPAAEIQRMRRDYQNLYTKLSPYQKVQITDSDTTSTTRSKSFFEMNSKQKAAMIGGAATSIIGMSVGAVIGAAGGPAVVSVGSMIGGQLGGQLNGFINSLAPSEQISKTQSTSSSTTMENKSVTSMLEHVDELLKRTEEYDNYGMWNVAGYFCSNDMSAAEIAASNYRSLMSGENTGREISAINSWRKASVEADEYEYLTTYLSRYVHPQFVYGGDVLVNAATAVSGKELGLHLGLPRATVPGLPVIEHAEFGKEVTTYQLIPSNRSSAPEDRITVGKVFDLGHVTNKDVELDNKSLNMHTFITGSTGSGKSNAVYQILIELRQDKIPFLVVEPAKGEYKDAFGHLPDVSVYSTNPDVAKLINLNPFMFPKSIHVLEHVDGLIEIFSVCWPMYDAMPAFFKDAILRSYEVVGWDLGTSTFDGDEVEYPDFEVLAEQLDKLIGDSEYASDIKSNYRGALLTRVKSLTVGLNKYIFTSEQTPYEQLFDKSCILDISRVKSNETKALIMGLMVYSLNEYRVDQRTESNKGLRHVTVLEEAHNLLKNTDGGTSELVGKSVEMITNTIAEIRTFGEGFIIVDQSPSSVDIAAIKNTNTKIILRTPEIHDREAVGRSIGLTDAQIGEVAKLPSGVAVVYQNNWVTPVLALLNKAPVTEVPYRSDEKTVISYGQIHSKMNLGTHLDEKLLRFVPAKMTSPASRLMRGDVVFADTSEDVEGLGNAVLVDTDDEVYSGYHTLTCRLKDENVLPEFFAYQTCCDAWRTQLRAYAMGVKVFSVTRGLLYRTRIIVPPIEEQKIIVEKLDKISLSIAEAQALLQQQVETLEAYKRSLIQEAVTKGIDLNAPMKPSGVGWIGDIPESWECKRLKYVAEMASGSTPDRSNYNYWNGDVRWVKTGELQHAILGNTEEHVTMKAVRECSLTLFPAGTVLVAMYGQGKTRGMTAKLATPCTTNQACEALCAHTDVITEDYLWWSMIASYEPLRATAQGSGQPNLNSESIGNHVIAIPPVSVQQEITNYLNAKCETIDKALAAKRKQIEVLRKQRESLIYEYVTGKRRVSQGA